MLKKTVTALVLGTSILGIGFWAGKSWESKEADAKISNFQKSTIDTPLIAKRVFVDNPNDVLINFISLRKSLKEVIEPYGDTFGFYFEYLPTGISIGINDRKEFSPHSFIKVPIAMAYYHYQERTKADKDIEVEVQEKDLDKECGDLWKKGTGYKISLDEAVKLAMIESDNTAG